MSVNRNSSRSSPKERATDQIVADRRTGPATAASPFAWAE
jgi:hypothetical protein